MVLDEQSGDHESYWKSSWEAHECLNKSIQQLLPLCHWRWAPPRLPPLLSRSCRPAPPSTTGFLSLLPAGPAGTQTAEEDRFFKKRENSDNHFALRWEKYHWLKTPWVETQNRLQETKRWTIALDIVITLFYNVCSVIKDRGYRHVCFLPVSCVGQTPCNRRKDTYTAACSDTGNKKRQDTFMMLY